MVYQNRINIYLILFFELKNKINSILAFINLYPQTYDFLKAVLVSKGKGFTGFNKINEVFHN